MKPFRCSRRLWKRKGKPTRSSPSFPSKSMSKQKARTQRARSKRNPRPARKPGVPELSLSLNETLESLRGNARPGACHSALCILHSSTRMGGSPKQEVAQRNKGQPRGARKERDVKARHPPCRNQHREQCG